jgi:hypothetical protein
MLEPQPLRYSSCSCPLRCCWAPTCCRDDGSVRRLPRRAEHDAHRQTGRGSGTASSASSSLTESRLVRRLLTIVALVYLGLFLVVPVIAVFAKALEGGVATYWAAISDPVALATIRLTVTTAAIGVPLNTLFGLAASWAIAKFAFPGYEYRGPPHLQDLWGIHGVGECQPDDWHGGTRGFTRAVRLWQNHPMTCHCGTGTSR